MTATQIRNVKYVIRGLLFGSFMLVTYGYFQAESGLEDNARVELFNSAFKDGYIAVNQSSAGQPLEATTIVDFDQLKPADQKKYQKDRWERMRKQTFRFIGAVNQGLGDPFEYRKDITDRGVVEKIRDDALRYQNPFVGERASPVTTPINSSEKVAQGRVGWRIVGKDLLLYLKPGGPLRRVASGAQELVEIGGEFEFAGRPNLGATLRIRTQGDGVLQSLRLDVSGGGTQASLVCGDRDYFVWDGRPFAVFRTNASVTNAEDAIAGDLVFTKMVNGKTMRVQVLGRTTANLIGSPVGGETGAIDGAFLHSKARRLILTLDPEIQVGAFFALASALRKLDSEQPARLSRARQGSATILDGNTGQILAQVGVPGYDPLWEAGRVILAKRQEIVANPANALHMPGSAVKVVTAGAGYLLFGDGSGEMLPTSINKLAIRQAFRNTYGGSMPPEGILTDEGILVPGAGDKYFQDNGGRQRLQKSFLSVLSSGFDVLNHKPLDEDVLRGSENTRKDLYEQVAGDLNGYFDAEAKYDFLPLRSRFPVSDADSMQLFRQLAIGGNETRFTTLRLAAGLATVSTSQAVHPFIVESVFDPKANVKDDRVTAGNTKAFSDLRTTLPDIEGAQNGNDRRMNDEMVRYLEQVCTRGSGHTGYYINSSGREIFMTEDDPTTGDFDEAVSRRGDFGKTGTADYGSIDDFSDSVFVYKHGHFIVAIWMERAHGHGVKHPANNVVNEIVRLIEQLEPSRS